MDANEVSSTPNRREALKIAGAAAMGGVAVSLASTAVSTGADAATVLSGRISVIISGVPVQGIVSVVPFISTSSSIQQSSPGSTEIISEPGDLITHGAVIKRLWSPSSDWLAWRMSVVNGQTIRKDVVMAIFDDHGTQLLKYDYAQCWVQDYQYPELHSHSHDKCLEQITIRPERHTIQ